MNQSSHKKGPGSAGSSDLSEESNVMLQNWLGGSPMTTGRKLAMPLVPSAKTPHGKQAQDVFNQLAHALTVLSGAADLMLANKESGANVQNLRTALQPNARQAEAAMHRLRELRLGPTHAMTELSHCLTILVLAADMLSEGKLSEADAQECYELLRRNADRAVTGLYELYALINPDAKP
jgi:hypothetical protein